MSLWEKAKDLYWNMPGLSDKEKEAFFYFLKGKLKGQQQGEKGTGIYGEYVETFSINHTFHSMNYYSVNFINSDSEIIGIFNNCAVFNLLPEEEPAMT